MSRDVDHLAEAVGELAEAELARRAGQRDTAEFALSVAQVNGLIAIAESVRELVETVELLSRGEMRTVVDDGVQLVTEGGVQVQPGDPDPTPDYPGAGYCGARSPGDGRICTWHPEHEGAHVAGNGEIVVEVWS